MSGATVTPAMARGSSVRGTSIGAMATPAGARNATRPPALVRADAQVQRVYLGEEA